MLDGLPPRLGSRMAVQAVLLKQQSSTKDRLSRLRNGLIINCVRRSFGMATGRLLDGINCFFRR